MAGRVKLWTGEGKETSKDPPLREIRLGLGMDAREQHNGARSHHYVAMSNSDLTAVLFLLLLLVGLAQLLGYVFVKLRQPKVIGEILAGIVLGPAVLGRFQIGSWLQGRVSSA